MNLEKKPKKQPTKEQPNLALRYTGIAFKMAVVILAGVFAGRHFDGKTEMEFPLWTLILAIVSVFLAMYIIIRDSSK